MAHLEIAYLTGDVERHELSKQQPVSIGSHKSNDICIDEDGVELMHCRVAWKKDGFEAVAAGVEGIDVNGSLVQSVKLSDGDVMRFGSADVTFRSEEVAAGGPAGGSASGDIGLKPITDEVPVAAKKAMEATAAESGSSGSSDPEASSGKRAEPEPVPPDDSLEEVEEVFEDDEWEEDSGFEALAAESRVDTPRRRSIPGREDRLPGRESAGDEDEPEAAADSGESAEEESGPEQPKVGLNERLRQSMRARQERPGEEDVLRSPLVLGLGGGAAVLVLVGVTFYFIAGRQTTQAEFDAATQLIDEGRYADGIRELSDFIVRHPGGSLAERAQVLMDLAAIDQHIRGAAPRWPQGMEALSNFVSNHRDDEDFDNHSTALSERAGEIALGAAAAAGRNPFDRGLLTISDDAETILRNLSRDNPPEQFLKQIDDTQRASEAAILRHETYTDALSVLDRQLSEKLPLQALVTYRDLLIRYPDVKADPQRGPGLMSRLEASLETERELVEVEELNRAGITEDHETDSATTVSLIFRARSRTDEVSVGQAVPALAQDCCYGVDTVTGEIRWRRVIGLNTPFFPLKEPTLPSVVLFDTNHNELQRLNLNSGALVWRQPLEERAAGEPLLLEGQIYVPTEGGHLYRIDLDSGTVSDRLQFSQSVTGPATTSDGEHLVVVGEREVAYTLRRRPLECTAVSFLEQKPASVRAPLLTMGPYILMCENTEATRSVLRLIDTRDPENLAELDRAEIAGHVLDAPVIRGKDLFVPSTMEKVSAFTVSDDPGESPLVAGPVYQATGPQRSPVYLSAGPDRQLWMASSVLRKLQLTTDALEADQNEVARGLASQPLQYTGGSLFNARRLPFADAVTLTQTDRDSMESEWRVVLGARLIACSPYEGEASLICATEAGSVFHLAEDEWRTDGVTDQAELLPLSPELEAPLLAARLPEGQIAIAAGDPEPRVWIITRRGQIDRSYLLDSALQLPPVPFGDRLLLPIPGKIQIARGSGQLPVQDFALASDEARSTAWRQVLVADENDLIAVTDDGQLIQVRYQTNPRPHLGEVSRVRLPAHVDYDGDLSDGLLVIGDSENLIRAYDAGTLDPRGEVQLPGPLSNDIWLVGSRVFVETDERELRCLDAGNGLSESWEDPVSLEGSGLAGPPVVQDSRLVIVERSGRVMAVDPETGHVAGRMTTDSPATGGAVPLLGELLVPLLDGSLVHVSGILAQ